MLARIRMLLRLRDTTVGLRAKEEHYRRLIEILPDAMAVLEPDGRIMEGNDQAAALVGYATPRELLGKNLFDLTSLADHDRIRAWMAMTLERGVLRNLEHTIRKTDGSSLAVEVNAVALKAAEGRPCKIVGVARDITPRKKAEEELRQFPRRIIEAQEAERQRVARELHDSVNQLLASVRMRLRKVGQSAAELRPSTREILARCEGLLVNALEENRRIAHDLR